MGDDTPVKAKVDEVLDNAEYLLGSLLFAFLRLHIDSI